MKQYVSRQLSVLDEGVKSITFIMTTLVTNMFIEEFWDEN